MSEDCLNPLIAQMPDPGPPCSPDCPVCNARRPDYEPMDAITAQMRQDAYQETRRLWREHYLEWLATRVLQGSPVTPFVPDPLAAEPTTFDPILGSA